MKSYKLYTTLFLFSIFGLLRAQTTKEEFFSDTRFAGGLYCPYISPTAQQTLPPKGYEPFYISHYGRHGSRWVISPDGHTIPIKILGEAADSGKLTDLGKSLLDRLKIAAEDAENRYGDLSQLGANEQRGIADRMVKSFPQVFMHVGDKTKYIYSRSTQVPRCIVSMGAFHEQLKSLHPELQIISEASKANIYLNNEAVLNRDTVKIIVTDFVKRNFNPQRFIKSLISDSEYANRRIEDQRNLAQQVFAIAVNLPNLDHLNFSLYDVFAKDEIFVLWQAANLHMYSLVGPSAVNGKSALKSASLLLRDILECAEQRINKQEFAADLRFGHDTYIIPLLALMDINGMNQTESNPDSLYKAWSSFKASPMGTNVQLIFYKNKSSEILVKFLLCEKEVQIPVATNFAPFYRWNDVKEYYKAKL